MCLHYRAESQYGHLQRFDVTDVDMLVVRQDGRGEGYA